MRSWRRRAQYQLPAKVDDADGADRARGVAAVGDASLGLVGSSRYSFTIDNPANKEFVELWQKEHDGTAPRYLRGRDVAGDAGDPGRHREGQGHRARRRCARRSTTVELDSIKGKIKMRECDHQAVQQGFMVKVVKKDGFSHPIPEVIATFPGERTTPGCKKTTYDD